MFAPFQRLGDTDSATGVGLGLAVSRGLTEAMRGTLQPAQTPGGGLTMTMSMPAAPGPTRARSAGLQASGGRIVRHVQARHTTGIIHGTFGSAPTNREKAGCGVSAGGR